MTEHARGNGYWQIEVTTPAGEVVIYETMLPTVYDVQGVIEEYLSDDENEGV